MTARGHPEGGPRHPRPLTQLATNGTSSGSAYFFWTDTDFFLTDTDIACTLSVQRTSHRELIVMLTNLPFALITAQRALNNEILSARPGAPVIVETPRTPSRPRIYRTRAALATRVTGVADLVAPRGWAPTHRAASSR
jgi:hypothetical protein